ncbi:MAG: response regulator [Pyrinomonadaceae bacterium]
MQVRFWGTRGSIATPGPGTNHFGGNTSCVELETGEGHILIFDCGTGARLLGAELLERAQQPISASILFGHTHWDHIQGFPFFAPAFMPGNKIDVYAPEGGHRSLQDVLAGQMEFTYFPVELDQLPATITYNVLAEGVYQIGGVSVTTQYLNHPAVTLGYRVECDGAVVVYMTDHEPFADTLWRNGAEPGSIESMVHEGDRRHARFMTGADLVIHDAQYTPEEYPAKKNWGHSTYEYVVELAAAAGVRQLALTHHDPAHDDAFIAEVEQRARAVADKRGGHLDLLCAYEGCTLKIEPRRSRDRFDPTISGSNPVRPPSLRILVVDDNDDLRMLTKEALQREHYNVIEASGGAEALRLIGEKSPDLVMLDLVMPDPDGLAVLRMLRAKPETAHLPVILLTGMDDANSIKEGFDAGATDYLAKPFSRPQLYARIRACLTRAIKP